MLQCVVHWVHITQGIELMLFDIEYRWVIMCFNTIYFNNITSINKWNKLIKIISYSFLVFSLFILCCRFFWIRPWFWFWFLNERKYNSFSELSFFFAQYLNKYKFSWTYPNTCIRNQLKLIIQKYILLQLFYNWFIKDIRLIWRWRKAVWGDKAKCSLAKQRSPSQTWK